ncbi:phosphotransferase family protein [Zhongshania marina]|uniref:Phosphotransferase family protein n=1 Tax=Zhongshania marina TaxID=2304603 RepID=A0ABX9W2E6_9GAMM|nr:phosphotransferase family protein [Zhongshania marina]
MGKYTVTEAATVQSDRQEAEKLELPLQKLLEREWGEPVVISGLRRLTGGAAAQTWSFNAADSRAEHRLIFRRGHDASQFGGALSKSEEAMVLNAAVLAGVPAPAVIAQLQANDGLGEGFLMRRIDGETLPQKILKAPIYSAARERMAGQCGEILATIHAVPLNTLQGLKRASAADQIAFYLQAFRGYQQTLPVFEYAFRWLAEHIPHCGEQTLVHGDFRNGNLMVGEDGIRAVLDWELSHIGDPMEDLAWLCVNSWRFGRIDKPVGGFGDRECLYSAYAHASGREVDRDAVRFWELFGVLKWGVICLYQCDMHLSGRERSLERVAIGRRVSECELDILDLLRGE